MTVILAQNQVEGPSQVAFQEPRKISKFGRVIYQLNDSKIYQWTVGAFLLGGVTMLALHYSIQQRKLFIPSIIVLSVSTAMLAINLIFHCSLRFQQCLVKPEAV